MNIREWYEEWGPERLPQTWHLRPVQTCGLGVGDLMEYDDGFPWWQRAARMFVRRVVHRRHRGRVGAIDQVTGDVTIKDLGW